MSLSPAKTTPPKSNAIVRCFDNYAPICFVHSERSREPRKHPSRQKVATRIMMAYHVRAPSLVRVSDRLIEGGEKKMFSKKPRCCGTWSFWSCRSCFLRIFVPMRIDDCVKRSVLVGGGASCAANACTQKGLSPRTSCRMADAARAHPECQTRSSARRTPQSATLPGTSTACSTEASNSLAREATSV